VLLVGSTEENQARNQQEHAGSSATFLHDLLFGPELESDVSVRNVALTPNYMALYSTRLTLCVCPALCVDCITREQSFAGMLHRAYQFEFNDAELSANENGLKLKCKLE
jgi:hypothetical protein